jgi:hypothetical protein
VLTRAWLFAAGCLVGLVLLASGFNYDNQGIPEFSILNNSDEAFTVVLHRPADGRDEPFDVPPHSNSAGAILRGCKGTGIVVLDAQHRLVFERPGPLCDGQALVFGADGSVVLFGAPTPTLVPSIPPPASRTAVPVSGSPIPHS